MAYKNKLIINPLSGQMIKFLQTTKDTNGKFLEMESEYRAHSMEPLPHYHPYQEEYFIIEKGQMTVRLEDKVMVLNEGDFLHIPVNTIHSMWNDSASPAVINWKVQPALSTEFFLETVMGLAADKTKHKRMKSFLQRSLMGYKYSDVFRISRPSFFVQKILFVLVAPFALLLGYRSSYKEYLD